MSTELFWKQRMDMVAELRGWYRASPPPQPPAMPVRASGMLAAGGWRLGPPAQ